MSALSVRRYCPREDELAVRQLFFKNAARGGLNRLYIRTVSQEVSFQVFLLASAVSFVSFDIPLHFCFTIPLLGALILYLLFLFAHYHAAWRKVAHLKRYAQQQQVAGSESSHHLSLVQDEEQGGTILGTLGLELKVDPDLSEPPGSVAWVNSFTLLPHEEEAARLLVRTAIPQYRVLHRSTLLAIEMNVNEDQQEEKSLLEKQGFHISKVKAQKYLGLFSRSQYRYRMEFAQEPMDTA